MPRFFLFFYFFLNYLFFHKFFILFIFFINSFYYFFMNSFDYFFPIISNSLPFVLSLFLFDCLTVSVCGNWS